MKIKSRDEDFYFKQMAWGVWKKIKDGAKRIGTKIGSFFKNGGAKKLISSAANVLDTASKFNETLGGNNAKLQNIIDRSKNKLNQASDFQRMLKQPAVSYRGRSFTPQFRPEDVSDDGDSED